MPGIATTPGESTRGGISVALFVFFVLGFALTTGAMLLMAQSGENRPADPEIIAKDRDKDLVQPRRELAPEKVVAIQLKGLVDASGGGIRQCFVFASPSNKQMTGPLSRFSAMVRTPPYDVLLKHHLTLIGKPVIHDENANVVVTVLDDRDQVHVFQFLLSKQHGNDFEDCWMTDGVYPLHQVESEDAEKPGAGDFTDVRVRDYDLVAPVESRGGHDG